MEEEKIKVRDTETGKYYRFHYNNEYIVAKVLAIAECEYAIRDGTTMSSGTPTLWNRICHFSAANYCTLAPPDEIAWLEHCNVHGYMSKKKFLSKFYHGVEKSNYEIF